MKFELDRLVSFEEKELIAEMRRVAPLVTKPTLTRGDFDAIAKVSSHTLIRRFGDWRAALTAAGLGDRYSGRSVTGKMRAQVAKGLTNDQIVAELQRVAQALGAEVVTREQLNGYSASITSEVVTRRFGSWKNGLAAAGLRLSNLGRRYSDDEYFENLLAVWTHHGRAPKFREMSETPSTIPGGAYEAKWKRWSSALVAFIERVNADTAAPDQAAVEQPPPPVAPLSLGPAVIRDEDRREIRLGLRYAVLSRDRFRCSVCGASPATDLSCRLHVDHIVPFAKGGKTVLGNLRALCDRCNIGKGSSTHSET